MTNTVTRLRPWSPSRGRWLVAQFKRVMGNLNRLCDAQQAVWLQVRQRTRRS